MCDKNNIKYDTADTGWHAGMAVAVVVALAVDMKGAHTDPLRVLYHISRN